MALQKNIFEEKSTNRNDYQVPKLIKPVRYHEWTRKDTVKEKVLRQKPYIPKDSNTMQPWRNIKEFPFYMYWETKPIIRTHPRTPFDKVDPIQDLEKYNIIKSRPRLYMSPAVSMDDIEDKDTRDLLCINMYTSTQQKADRDITWKYTQHDIPNCTFEEVLVPVREDYGIFTPLSTEKKKYGKYWEPKQHTTLVDPSQTYWTDYYNMCILNKVIPAGRDPFERGKPLETRRYIRELIDRDELRQAYDKRKQGFTGYYPRNMTGPLRKQELEQKQKTSSS